MNLVIVGTSRCGKTMLSNMIFKTFPNYNKIQIDGLKDTFKEVFPSLEIDFSKKGKGNLSDFPKFLERYFDRCIYKDNQEGNFYLIDGGGLPEDSILRFAQKSNTKVIFLGKTQITPEEYFNQIRKYETTYSYGGWTKRLDDETLLSWATDWIRKSQKYKQFCEENNLLFFDTSFNQVEVLQDIINKIKENRL